MRIAFYNVQNLYHRHKDFIIPSKPQILFLAEEMNCLMRKNPKEQSDFHRIKELSFLLGFEKIKAEPYATMRKRGGEFYFKRCRSSLEKKATPNNSWNGWVEIQTLPINEDSTKNKARTITEVNADVLLLQAIEDRHSLLDFNQEFLNDLDFGSYNDFQVLQGNDYRGMEMALLTKEEFRSKNLQPFTLERNAEGNLLFGQNLIKFKIETPKGNKLWLIAAQFEPPGDNTEAAEYKRVQQSHRVAEIYTELKEEGEENIIVAGTLNAVSYCYSLSSLLQKTDLKDITRHSSFEVDLDCGKDAAYFRMGAYRKGVNIKQKDYLLLSPKLYEKVRSSGLNRKGVWCENRPQWSMYNTISNKSQAASEHPVIWTNVDI